MESMRFRFSPSTAFRFFLFLGVLVHFLPVILAWTENYGAGAFRVSEGFEILGGLPDPVLKIMAGVLVLGSILAMIGIRTRIMAGSIFLSAWVLVSANSLNLNTLGLWTLFHLLLIGTVLGDRNWRSFDRIAIGSLLFQPLISVFFSGLEKLFSGWMFRPVMFSFLNSNETVVRPWVLQFEPFRSQAFCGGIQWITLVLEIALPILVLIPRARRLSFWLWQGCFLGVGFTLAIPPLFYFEFAAAGFLILLLPGRPV
jgi:hypothetical protein